MYSKIGDVFTDLFFVESLRQLSRKKEYNILLRLLSCVQSQRLEVLEEELVAFKAVPLRIAGV